MMRSIEHMWNERYAEDDYAYGTTPNDFLIEQADRLPEGPMLCLAPGRGAQACRRLISVSRSPAAVTRGGRLADRNACSVGFRPR
jgi:hypothetical protein